MTARHFQLQVRSEISALQQVLAWFEQSVLPLLPQQQGWQCELALTEAFTNVVRHAHQNLPPDTPIELEIDFDRHLLEMRIWDCGSPFDLNSQLQSIDRSNLASLDREGGRGLSLLARLSDEIYYFPALDRQRNCLLLRKQLN
jgi:serine/threonine-protein kinase RsbW